MSKKKPKPEPQPMEPKNKKIQEMAEKQPFAGVKKIKKKQ